MDVDVYIFFFPDSSGEEALKQGARRRQKGSIFVPFFPGKGSGPGFSLSVPCPWGWLQSGRRIKMSYFYVPLSGRRINLSYFYVSVRCAELFCRIFTCL